MGTGDNASVESVCLSCAIHSRDDGVLVASRRGGQAREQSRTYKGVYGPPVNAIADLLDRRDVTYICGHSSGEPFLGICPKRNAMVASPHA
jgi:hypothetical protein